MPRKVELVPYDPTWEQAYKQEATRLRTILGDEIAATYHMGSTAIPGILAKPIIDVLLEVKDISRLDQFDDVMDAAGYHPRGEFGIPGRRYYYVGDEERHTVHVHAFQSGHPDIERHLSFCAYLRAHPEDARAYSNLKRELAVQYPEDTSSYTDAKGPLIREIEQKALAWYRSLSTDTHVDNSR